MHESAAIKEGTKQSSMGKKRWERKRLTVKPKLGDDVHRNLIISTWEHKVQGNKNTMQFAVFSELVRLNAGRERLRSIAFYPIR